MIHEWADASVDVLAEGPSADFLRNTGRDSDIHFVLHHVDDVDGYVVMRNGVLEFVKGT